MAQAITLWGASYTQVPAITLPKTGGGTAKFIDEDSVVTYYTSTSAPTSQQGSNGDIWLKTVS